MRTFVLLGVAVALAAAPAASQCPAEQATAFDFLVGTWDGVVYNLSGQDSTRAGPTARVVNTKVLTGCALEERWHFEENGRTEVDGILLRAYDAASRRWSYDLATSHAEHVTYSGQFQDGVWRFFYTLVTDGRPVGIRITWVPTPTGYSEQIARSSDGGATWVLTRHVNFVPARSPH